MKDFTVTLISNGSEQYFSDNTLTNFTNQLPNDISLSKNKKWYVSLQNLGIDLNYENLGISKDIPSIITFNGDEFEKQFKILKKHDLESSTESITSKILTNNSLKSPLNLEELTIRPQFFTIEKIGKYICEFITKSLFLKHRLSFKLGSTQFKISPDASYNVDGLEEYKLKNPTVNKVKIYRAIFKNRSNVKIGLCIHELLYSAYKFYDDETRYSLNINGHSYKVVFLTKNQYLTSAFLIDQNFPRLATNICHIHCNVIDPYNYNQEYCQILRTVSLPRANKYHFVEFENPTYFKLNCSELNSINIKLTNSIFEQLPLLPGVPSTIKLKIQSMEGNIISNLKVSSNSKEFSTFNNTNNHFRIKIPPNLDFSEPNLQMSVSSITYPNKFASIPNFEQNKYIYVFDTNTLELTPYTLKLRKSMFVSNSDLLTELKTVFNEWKNSNGLVIERTDDKFFSLKSNSNLIIAFPLQLALLLGLKKDLVSINEKGIHRWNDDKIEIRSYISPKMKQFCKDKSLNLIEELSHIQNKVKESVDNYFFICLSMSDIYKFDHEINVNKFKPKYFLLYNNICQYSIFDTKYLPILKIIPIKNIDSEYITIEFKNDEYIGIQVSHPNYLEFILRAHTGELLEFANTIENVILDLSFKKINYHE